MSGAICPIKATIFFPEPSGKYLISLNTQITAQMTRGFLHIGQSKGTG